MTSLTTKTIKTDTGITFERESKFAINVMIDGKYVGQIETDPIQDTWIDVNCDGLSIFRSASSVEAAKKAVQRLFA